MTDLQAMAHEAGEQAGERGDRLRNLSKRLDAAAGQGGDEVEDQIRSHPDVQVTHILLGFHVLGHTGDICTCQAGKPFMYSSRT